MPSAQDEDPGNPTINFHGEPRRNDTHQSTTDPDSGLYREVRGKEARLYCDAHRQLYRDVKFKTFGTDKGYHQKGFVQGCRERGIAPYVARKDKVQVAGLDGRTTTRRSYQVSLKIRKRVEEIFGWIKTVGGLRRSQYRGLEQTQAWGYFVVGTYNPLRLARRRRPKNRPRRQRGPRPPARLPGTGAALRPGLAG